MYTSSIFAFSFSPSCPTHSQPRDGDDGQAEGDGAAVARAHRPHDLRPAGEVRAVHRALLGRREERRATNQGGIFGNADEISDFFKVHWELPSSGESE